MYIFIDLFMCVHKSICDTQAKQQPQRKPSSIRNGAHESEWLQQLNQILVHAPLSFDLDAITGHVCGIYA